MKNITELVGRGACAVMKDSEIGRLQNSISPTKKIKGEALRGAVVEALLAEAKNSSVAIVPMIEDVVNNAYEGNEALFPLQCGMEKEKENVKLLALRGAKALKDTYLKFEKGGREEVMILDESYVTRVDLYGIDESKNKITAIRVETGKPVIKNSGRTPDTSVKKNPVVYSLLRAALKKGISRGMAEVTAEAMVLYLRSADDKRGVIVPSLGKKEIATAQLSAVAGTFNIDSEKPYLETVEEMLKGKACKGTDCDFCPQKKHCNYVPSPVTSKQEVEDTPISSMQFTKAQKEAISFYQGCARVIAGAGSGKTTTTCVRVAELVQAGEDPSSILFIAFTNASVKATKDKLRKVFDAYGFDKEDADAVKVYTFNSFGAKLLEDNYRHLDSVSFTDKPKVLDEVAKYDILLSTMNLLGIEFKELDSTNPFLRLGETKGLLPTLSEIFDDFSEYDRLRFCEEDAESIETLYDAYRKALERANLVTFRDQIELSRQLLETNPGLIENYGIAHIIVDEFQDTSEDDMSLLSEIANSKHFVSLMVVGDDMQCIYSFRGSKVENFLELGKKLGMPVTDIYFTDNFRSTDKICNYADKVGNKISFKLPKKLVAHKTASEGIECLMGKEFDAEAIATKIAECIKNGKSFKDIAFIGRNRREVMEVQKCLTMANIPSQTDLSINCLENSRVQAVIGLAGYLLSLIEGDEPDEVAVYDFMDAIYEGVLSPTLENINKVKGNIETLKNLFENSNDEERGLLFKNIINNLRNGDEVYDVFLNSLDTSKSIGQLLKHIVKLEKYNITLEARVMTSQDAVTLLTAHSSKGLEFDTVIVSLSNFGKRGEDWDDVLRLSYVAVTRAKEKLIIQGWQTVGVNAA